MHLAEKRLNFLVFNHDLRISRILQASGDVLSQLTESGYVYKRLVEGYRKRRSRAPHGGT